MKKYLKTISILLAFSICLFSLSMPASAALIGGDGGFYYSLKSNRTATLEEYHGNSSDIAIPSSIYSYAVTSIAENTFSNNTTIKSVEIPDTVNTIGAYAFYGCTNLEKVTLSSSVTQIKAATFYGCNNLTKIIIPASVTQIAANAFIGSPATIVGERGSFAEQYAQNNGIEFKDYSEVIEDTDSDTDDTDSDTEIDIYVDTETDTDSETISTDVSTDTSTDEPRTLIVSHSLYKDAPQLNGRNKFPDGFRILQGKQEYITYLDHSSIRIWPSETAAHFDQHTHSAIEIIMPQQGASVYHMLDAVYRVQAGEILIIPSGCPHELTEYQDTMRYLLLFEPNPLLNLRDMPSISAMMQQPIYLHDDSVTAKQVSDLLMQAVDCYFMKEPMWNTRCYSYLLQMYALLGQKYLEGTPQRVTNQRNIDPAIMNSAITYINENYMHDISLEDVAVFAGFSKCYFSRTFKQFSGVSFLEYLTRKRLNVAADMLMRTNRPIHEVAKKSGFGSTATFNRVFRDHKNCTPSQYRAIYSMGVDPENDKMLL